jgi:hypothetical protein
VLDQLALRQVLTHGEHLSRRWRATLERILRAQVIDVYGVSEIAGSTCHECSTCGYFHPPPIVVAEVVAPDSDGTVLRTERGELVLTALAPFQVYQPLIRYRTGDIVEVGPPCPAVDDLGFRPVGRLTDRSSAGMHSALTFPSHLVAEVLDNDPDVARVPYPRLADFGIGPVYGAPIHRVRTYGEGGAISLDVQLSYALTQFPDRAAAACARVKRRLEVIGRGAARVEVVPRDSSDPLPADSRMDIGR